MMRIVAAAAASLWATGVVADECTDRVKVHGLLTRAYVQCPLTYYAKGFASMAELCRDKIGDAKYKALLSEGAQAFDARASEQGRDTFCTRLTRDFAYTIRR
jgi:hypothetical protein